MKKFGLKAKFAGAFSAGAVAIMGFSPLGIAYAAPGELANVETWDELKAAIQDAPTNSTIVLTKDIVAGEQLDIAGKNLTIEGASNVTISRQAGNTNFPVFHVGDGGELTLGENLTVTGKQNGDCVSYTINDFASGSADDPHGFFLEVDKGGVATLDGATLTNFITSADMEWAAPVVANGGEFNIKSGAITANSVGYTADNSKSTDGTTADLVGVEEPDDDPSHLIKQWKRTNTAGGVIYNGGAIGEFIGGSVNGNRADTGAIVVQGSGSETAASAKSTVRINTDALIDNNTGVHYAGGVFIYNGGRVFMDGGTISNNFAWSKGGGVWAMSEVYGTAKFRTPGTVKYVAPAEFALGHPVASGIGGQAKYEGKGVIKGNLSVSRGGGINVSSNNVALFSGQIIDNGTRTTGGGVYVEGDAADHMYQLYVAKGWVTDNHAVKETGYWWNGQPEQYKEWNAYLDRGLPTDGDDACQFSNDFVAGSSRTGNYGGGINVQGNGGGLWMCAFGGNTTLDYTGTVEIGGNTANPITNQQDGGEWDPAKKNNLLRYGLDNYAGRDIMLSPGLPGDGSALNIVGDAKANGTTWTNDNADGAEIESNRAYTGGLGLTNSTWTAPASTEGGVLVSGNIARLGGGLGADGSMVFGNDDDIYRMMSSFRFTKTWGSDITKHPVAIELWIQAKDPQTGEYVNVSNLGGRLNFTLDGEPSSDGIVSEVEPWVAEVGLPLTLQYIDADGNPQLASPYSFKTPDGKVLDPANMEDLKELYRLVQAGTLTKDNISFNEWRVKVIEKAADGTVGDYVVNLSDVSVDKLYTYNQPNGETKYASSTDPDAVYTHFDTNFIGLNLSQTLANEEVQVEKYVNKKVHADIVDFDKTFTYDIMAWVPAGSTEVTLEDTLIDDLMFVDADGNPQYVYDGNGGIKENDKFDASKVVVNNADRSMLVLSKNNNHKGDGSGTVASLDSAHDGLVDPSGKVSVNGKKITLALDEAAIADITKNGTAYEGKWVRLSFDAQISPDRYDALVKKLTGETVAASDLTWSNLDDAKYGSVQGIDDEKLVEMYRNPGGNRYYARTMYHDKDGNEVYNWYGRWYANTVFDGKDTTPDNFAWYKIPDGTTGGSYVHNGAKVIIGPENINGGLYGYDKVNKNADGTVAYPAVAPSEWEALSTEEVGTVEGNARTHLTDWFYKAEGIANYPVVDGADTNNGAHEGLPNSAGYKVKFANNSEYTYDTNTVTVKPEYTKIKVKKEFAGGWPADVAEVKVNLKLDGKVIETLTLKKDAPEAESAELAKFVDMNRYTVDEQPIKGYEATISGDAVNGFTVTNTAQKFDVLISKNALGGSEIEGAKIVLKDASGDKVDEWISGKEAHKVTLIPGEYVMEETVAPEGYQKVTTKMKFKVNADGSVKLVTTTVDNGGKISVLNGSHIVLEDAPEATPGKVNVHVTKKWVNDSRWSVAYGSSWPAGLTVDVQLYAGDKAVGKAVTLSEDTPEYTWKDLDELTDGNTYVVKEVSDGKFWQHDPQKDIKVSTAKDTTTYTVTNHLIPRKSERLVDFSKTAVNGTDELPGALLKVTGTSLDGTNVNEEWTSTSEMHKISLKAGEYVMTEIRAPQGYEVAESITFRITENGDVEVKQADGTWALSTAGNVHMEDAETPDAPERHEVRITKADLGGVELAGARMTLRDTAGNIVDEWISTTQAHSLSLVAGEYVLIETVAPEGYHPVTTEMHFRVSETGEVTLVTTEVNNGGKIEVTNGNSIILKDAPDGDTPAGGGKGEDQPKPTTTVPTANVPTPVNRLSNTGVAAGISAALAGALMIAGGIAMALRRRTR